MLFDNFVQYLDKSILEGSDITDTISLKYILLNSVFSESTLDTLDKNHFKYNEIPTERLKEFISNFGTFYEYLFENRVVKLSQHLKAIPSRLSIEKCIFNKLSSFQQENTLVYFDDRHPEKILGFMLFIPRIKDKISSPRIWSWTLIFQFGLCAFKSPMGTVGLEYLISDGVIGPKPEEKMEN